MDIVAALAKAPPKVVLCGNLDPSAVFCQSSPEQVRLRVGELLAATKSFPNYVVSSGCDLPPRTNLENLDAFYEALASGPEGPTARRDIPADHAHAVPKKRETFAIK